MNIVYFDLGQGKDYIYKGGIQFEGLHKKDILQLSSRQKETFLKEKVSDIFPEYYIIKVNKFNDKAKDTLDEWVYFFKNSEVKDEFRVKGLKEAQQVLDIMRLNKEQQYGYNRYLDYLHLKASEALSLREEAEYKVKENLKLEIAKKLIGLGSEDSFVMEATGLTLGQIGELRKK